jgi:hypothetical protein
VSARAAAAVLLCLAALLAGGCGGDDEKSSADGAATQTTSTPDTAATDTATTPTPKRVTTPTETAGDNGGTTSPEKQPGGAGDEVPNSTQALVTGRSGKLAPAKVSVPPFISVTVELRSGDGLDYALRGGGKSLGAGEGHNSASATFDGLRPGKSLVLSGPQGRVVISADADPGP